MRRISQPRRAGRSLEHDRTGIAVAESLYSRVFLAESTQPDSSTIGEVSVSPHRRTAARSQQRNS